MFTFKTSARLACLALLLAVAPASVAPTAAAQDRAGGVIGKLMSPWVLQPAMCRATYNYYPNIPQSRRTFSCDAYGARVGSYCECWAPHGYALGNYAEPGIVR